MTEHDSDQTVVFMYSPDVGQKPTILLNGVEPTEQDVEGFKKLVPRSFLLAGNHTPKSFGWEGRIPQFMMHVNNRQGDYVAEVIYFPDESGEGQFLPLEKPGERHVFLSSQEMHTNMRLLLGVVEIGTRRDLT